jgi:hypothetical protein
MLMIQDSFIILYLLRILFNITSVYIQGYDFYTLLVFVYLQFFPILLKTLFLKAMSLSIKAFLRKQLADGVRGIVLFVYMSFSIMGLEFH